MPYTKSCNQHVNTCILNSNTQSPFEFPPVGLSHAHSSVLSLGLFVSRLHRMHLQNFPTKQDFAVLRNNTPSHFHICSQNSFSQFWQENIFFFGLSAPFEEVQFLIYYNYALVRVVWSDEQIMHCWLCETPIRLLIQLRHTALVQYLKRKLLIRIMLAQRYLGALCGPFLSLNGKKWVAAEQKNERKPAAVPFANICRLRWEITPLPDTNF